MKIGLIIAMQKELDLFADCLQNFEVQTIDGRQYLHGQYKQNEIVAVVCGMGKVNAACGALMLLHHFKSDIIVNVGISGGLDNSVAIGDFVIGKDIVYHDVWCGENLALGQVQNFPLYFHSDPALIAKLPAWRQALLCSGDWFVTTADELQKIKTVFPEGVAIDMESAAIAQVCHAAGVPMLSVRQISDTPGIEHHAEQYAEFWRNAANRTVEVLQNILDAL